MKPGVKIALGIFTSVATAGFIFVYDFYIKDRIDSAEVVVVKAGEEILKSEKITKNKLVIERRPKEALIDDVVLAQDMEQIVGQDSSVNIVGNSMISTKMIDFEQLIPDETKGEAIRPITKEMIYAQPGSLRRKDSIDIYLINQDGTTNLTTNGAPEVISETKAETDSKEADSKEEAVVSVNTKPFLKDVRVVYVKDSGNKEVVSATEGNKGDKRLDATSTISDLEVILNEEDFTKLMGEVLGKGARLYITYH
ncbi:hypothetical protein NVV31_23515 [Cytobacillus firmus]|uniref:hypothetical protein n=1 Tax=Cytobacillus firmus TaxID=1399 RepID=UPI0021C75A71|nr:hypothetical protein [Cytobacillus firmus]MCU1808343.1 hypothetical protein [Cytobacillus firmus]